MFSMPNARGGDKVVVVEGCGIWCPAAESRGQPVGEGPPARAWQLNAVTVQALCVRLLDNGCQTLIALREVAPLT